MAGSPPVCESYETILLSATATDSHTITKPSGVVQGDLLLLCVGINSSSTSISLPSGFSEVIRSDAGSASLNRQTAVGWKIAGASEPSDYTVTLGASQKAGIALIRFSNVEEICPVGIIRADFVANTTAHRGPAVTADSHTRAVRFVVVNDDYATMTADSGMTEILNTETTTGSDTAVLVGCDTAAYDISDAVPEKGWIGTTDNSHQFTLLIYGDEASGMEAATPAYESQTEFVLGAATSYEIDKPSGTVENDLLLFIMVDPQGGSASSLDGFTLISNGTDSPSGRAYYASYKVAGASEPSTYTLTPGSPSLSRPVGTLMRISGANTSTPINASSFDETWDDSGTTNEFDCPAVTTTGNCLIIRGCLESDDDIHDRSLYILPNCGTKISLQEQSSGNDAGFWCYREAVCVNNGSHKLRHGWRPVTSHQLPFTIAVAAP